MNQQNLLVKMNAVELAEYIQGLIESEHRILAIDSDNILADSTNLPFLKINYTYLEKSSDSSLNGAGATPLVEYMAMQTVESGASWLPAMEKSLRDAIHLVGNVFLQEKIGSSSHLCFYADDSSENVKKRSDMVFQLILVLHYQQLKEIASKQKLRVIFINCKQILPSLIASYVAEGRRFGIEVSFVSTEEKHQNFILNSEVASYS